MAQKFLTDIEVTRGLVDSSGDLGVAGQVLSSTGSGTNWITNEANSTVVYLDEFTGDNSTVDFTLSVSVTDENITQVYIDGVYQNKDTYSVSGTTLTFSTAPPLNADIEVITFSTATTSDDLSAGSVIIPVKNTHTASIAKGEPVYITGNVGSSARLQIAPADASNSAKMPAAGLLLQTLAVNAEGYVITGGYLRNITTDTIDGTSTSSNDTVYVKSGGGLTMTKPTGTNLIQNIAKVARSSSGNSGSLLVSSILRTNDVPNITNDYFWLGNSSGVATPTEFTSTARGLLSVGAEGTAAGDGNLAYNNSSGVFTYTPPVLGGLSGTTDNITEGSTNLYYTDARSRSSISAGGNLSYNSTTGVMSYTTPTTIASLSNHDTDDLSEGSTNLYYTDTRVGTYLTNNSYATQSYVNTQVSNLVDSAPSTLDTLNELAAALGDDANFSTTVTNSIATKLPLAGGTLTGALQAQSWLFRSMSSQVEYHVLNNGNLNGPSWKFRYDAATANRWVDFGYKDGNGTYYEGLKLYNNSTISWKGTDIINASSQWVGGIASSGYNNTNWDTAYTYSQVGHLPLAGGTLTGGLNGTTATFSGAGTFTSDSTSARVLYLEAGSSNGNIIQFQRSSVNKWELVGREGTFYIYKNDGTGSGMKWQIDTNGNHSISGNATFTTDVRAPIFYDSNNTAYYLDPTSTSNLSALNVGGSAVWTSGNDGSGSGLDADLLDGVQGSGYYRHYETTAISNYDSLTAGAWTTNSTTATNIAYANYNATWHLSDTASDRQYQIFLADTSAGGLRFRAKQGASGWHSWEKVWTDVNDGAGSGLDADLLDGQQGSYYAQASLSNNKTYTSTGNAAGSYLGGHYSSGGTEKPNSGTFGSGKLKLAMLGNGNLGFGDSWNDVLWMSSYNGGDVKRSTALVSSKYDNTSLWVVKQNYDSSSWGTGYLIPVYGANPGSGSLYAASFIDANNTSFYIDPSNAGGNTSILAAGVIKGNYFVGTNYTTNGYTVYKGYDNWNHFISIRGHARPGQAKAQAAILGGHQTSFVEYAENNSTTGWFFIGSANSTYEEIAKITKDFASFTQVRAPIFYDSNDTTYYIDPNSTGTSLNAAGSILGSNINTNIKYLGGGVNYDTDRTTKVTNGIALYSGYSTGSNRPHTYDFAAQFVGASRGFELSAAWHSQTSLAIRTLRDCCQNWSSWYTFALHGLNNSTGALYAGAYYDASNTGYYTDPASTSVLNALQFNYTQHGSANNIRMGNSTTMNAISSGTNNAAFGVEALGACSTGSRNFAYGYAALFSLSSGSNNIAMGDATGYNVTSGSNNLLFGHNAGRTGYQSPQSIAGITTGSNQIHMGNESHTTARIQISWTVNSDARDKTDITPIDVGLDFVNQLNPVTFRWDKRSDYEDRTPTGENKLEELTLGFLAQEVEEVEKAYGYDVATKTNLVVDRDVEQDHFGITYEKMIPILTKAIQELTQEVQTLKDQINGIN